MILKIGESLRHFLTYKNWNTCQEPLTRPNGGLDIYKSAQGRNSIMKIMIRLMRQFKNYYYNDNNKKKHYYDIMKRKMMIG